MSTEAKITSTSGNEDVENISPQPCPPQFYPGPNYQGPQHPPWFPPVPIPPGSSGPWPGPWGYPGPNVGWAGGKTNPKTAVTVPPPAAAAAATADEYTVDTMRRIYNDDDGRVEIQRVKVQRKQPEIPPPVFPSSPDSMSIVPVGTFPLNEKRPPPRKNKLKRQMQLMQASQGQPQMGQPHQWYPYMPYPHYPYPYPYYYGGGCMWPPPSMPGPPMSPWPSSDDTDRTTSRQDSLPSTLDSQRLDSRISEVSRSSHSPFSQRSVSPAATAQSLAPSDSISVGGYKDRLRGPTPPPRTKSRASGRIKAIMAPSDIGSDVGDQSSVCTDIVPYQKIPPRRKKRGTRTASISEVGSTIDQIDTDSISDRISVISDATLDDSSRLSPEISYAFKKFEQSVDVFHTKVSGDTTPVNTPPASLSPVIVHSIEESTPKDNIDVVNSDKLKVIDDYDYIDKSEASFNSLPLLETAPIETSESTSTKIIKLPTLTDVPIVCDPKPEETTTITNNTASVPDSTTSTTESIPVSNSITTNVSDMNTTSTDTVTAQTVESNPPIIPASVQEAITVQPAIAVTVPSSTADTAVPEITSLSNQIKQESQTAVLVNDNAGKETSVIEEKQDINRLEIESCGGRDSRASSSTFFSVRPSDELHFDTDSTDIVLPTTDINTADEGGDGTDWTPSSPVIEDNDSYKWVLQQPGEVPDLTTADCIDERRNAWRAEVSLWRAKLVVSLCRGRGLDRQDWATFHLLVHHPLTMDLKLSLLHAHRICTANSTIGAALVRVALIHLAQHGELLLQPEANRTPGWRTVTVDPNQSWAPVKGSVEILKALGYQEREDGVLKYPRRSAPEVSVLARLTLDMLVLAEELRLYLTGTHQYPTNISDLFFPGTMSMPVSMDCHPVLQDMPRPPSSADSYSFMSAQSSTSLNLRSGSRASSVTDEDTETLQPSVKPTKTHSKKIKQLTSSEEEITLKEDLMGKKLASSEVVINNQESQVIEEGKIDSVIEKSLHPSEPELSLSKSSLLDQQSLNSLDMSSLPDLQSIRSSNASLMVTKVKEAESTSSITPISTPLPPTEETNPEDHIYEEIDLVKQQVQALRSASVPVDAVPPPLPPKKKISSGGEDDSGLSLTYPHMEWTSSSMPGSLRGGSTGARKKKRRAPMPPDFMPQNWKPYENNAEDAPINQDQEKIKTGKYSSVDGNKIKTDTKKSLNPFYEEIDSIKEEVKELENASEKKAVNEPSKESTNPFEQEKYPISGFIGKNPFYEDINEDEELKIEKKDSHSSAPSPIVTKPGMCGMGSLSELQDESILLRTKRRAPKPPTPDPSRRSTTPQPAKSSPSPAPIKHPSEPPPDPPVPVQLPSSTEHPEPLSDSHFQTSSVQQPAESSQKTQEFQTSTPSITQPTVTPPLSPPVTQQPVENTSTISITNAQENKTQTQKETKRTESKDKKELKEQASTKPVATEKDKVTARKIVSNAIKASLQRLSIHHPTIPPPPPPPKLDDEEEIDIVSTEKPCNDTTEKTCTVSTEKSSTVSVEKPSVDSEEKISITSTDKTSTTSIEKPSDSAEKQAPISTEKSSASAEKPSTISIEKPSASAEKSSTVSIEKSSLEQGQQKNVQSLLDDIPYADDAYYEKQGIPKPQINQAPQYEIPELPSADGAPVAAPLSPATLRQTALLLSGHGQCNVPFIDDSDIPPDCPPPPPPTSPPSSPPETPHTSPPETPHVSPPETPHNSPPESPSGSRSSSPSKVNQDTSVTKIKSHLSTKDYAKIDKSKSTSKEESLITQETKPPEETKIPPAEETENQKDESVSITKDEAKTDEQVASEENAKKNGELTLPADTETAEAPPLPPKTSATKYAESEKCRSSSPSASEMYANQSIVSDRYEIPEAPGNNEKSKLDNTINENIEKVEESNKDALDIEEERYEIPEVIKETSLSVGPEGIPIKVSGPAHGNRLAMESVFGAPKPPNRRRRNNSITLPPPRPPKNFPLDESGIPRVPPKSAMADHPGSTSTGTSFATASLGPGSTATGTSFGTASQGSNTSTRTATSFRGTLKHTITKPRSKTRKSWPMIFCDCMYVNCKNYDGVDAK